MTVAEQFGLNLRRARRKAGLSQRELGSLVNMSGPQIANLENAKRRAHVETLVRLAGVLGIDPCELLEGTRGLTTEGAGLPTRQALYAREVQAG